MDILAHFVWTFLLFYRTSFLRPALFFSIAPDLFSWGIYSLYRIAMNIPFGKPVLSLVPEWVFTLYGFTHSLIVFGVVASVVWFWRKKIPWFLGAWLFHIMVDIPSHSREFLGTPFLWPFSSWVFPGISWGTPEFMITNYVLIATLLAATITFKRNLFLPGYETIRKILKWS